MRFRSVMLALCLLATGAATALAADPPPTAEEKALIDKYTAITKQLHPRFGDVRLPEADATLHLGQKYYFLGASEAKLILKDAWGNSDESVQGVLGIVFPVGKSFFNDTWGAVITYEGDGYVADDDASSADYGAMLKSIQDSEDEVNRRRKAQGLETIHVVGWAQQPFYDSKNHTMIWARNIKFGAQTDDTLNYDLRTLGRRGILSLNLVTTMSHLADTRASANELQGVASFNAGARYADYNADSDKKAEYGVAGLVAAGVGAVIAQKVGLFGLALLFFKKIAIFVAAAGGAVVAWFRRLFNRNKQAQQPVPPAPPV